MICEEIEGAGFRIMMDAAAVFQRAIAALSRPRHATYRLQLGPWLRFDQVAELAPCAFNGTPAEPSSFDLLDRLLSERESIAP